MKEIINSKSEAEQQTIQKPADLKSLKIASELPQDFFDSSSDDKQSSPSSKGDIAAPNNLSAENTSPSVVDEETQDKIKSLQTKISELENLLKLNVMKEQEMSNKVSDLQRSKSLESVNTEYIKNIYVNYLKYKAMKNDKEAKTCEQVLFTALLLSQNEITDIEKLRKKYKNYKFWKLLPQSSFSKKKEKEDQNSTLNPGK